MKAKIILFAFALLLFTLFAPNKIQAQEKASGSSATFNDILAVQYQDNRVLALTNYLEAQDSPLAPYAATFIAQADMYKLDWKLLPAIAGTESTFAKAEPAGCYNSFGFGIYTNHMTCFASYDEAIRIIAQTLRTRYMDEWGAGNVEEIGARYAASPTWAAHTQFFINQIQAFALLPVNSPLSISQ